MAALSLLIILITGSAHAADDASMPNVVQAIREIDNLMSMTRGMLSMIESDIARAKGKPGAPVKDLEDQKGVGLEMIGNLTKERARLQAIVDAWGAAFDANLKLGGELGELNETRSRLLTWGPRNPNGSINPWYAQGDIFRMRGEVTRMESEIPELKKAAEDAQKKFDDLMKKNAARESADAQARAGTEALRREIKKFPDPEFFFETEPRPSSGRWGSRFLLQPIAPGPFSPEMIAPIETRSPEPMSLMRPIESPEISPTTQLINPDIIPFPRIIPIRPETKPKFPGPPKTLPFKRPSRQRTLPFRAR